MSWVVDTCMLIDVLDDDPRFGRASALTLDSYAEDGLVVCPLTYAELAPAFQGDTALQDEFLDGIGADFRQDWTWPDTLLAHHAWHRHIHRKRRRNLPRRPIADVLIGAFASRFQGLLTRNAADFAPLFPDLPLGRAAASR
ncbi:MAG TPA: type II toxin-antitoxin system VapC family toxin [Thermoanaerobaculia bacterium]|jgi:predicted nucleic acid-binding protein|nr:type II toxin-antitoxin system VapC family toxin [Thermoanaerobaculia bacterium]